MEIWSLWTHALESSLGLLALHFGMSEALAIIVLTFGVRLALMPVSLASAYRMQVNKEKMERLKPQIDALKASCQGDRKALAARTMALYREHGVVPIDSLTVFNLVAQSGFGIGLFQALSRSAFGSGFLWIASLAKPDVWLTVLVTLLMALGMALMPGATSDVSMLLLLAIPLVLSVLAVAALPSAIGLYWAVSNAVTLIQTLALRALMARHARMAV